MNWNSKLIWSASFAGLFGVTLLFIAMRISETPQDQLVNVALVIFGTAAGWLVGTLLSPYNEEEQGQFARYGQALTAFAGGYGIAKLDKVIEHIFLPENLLQPLWGFRVIAVIVPFILAILITFLFRRFA